MRAELERKGLSQTVAEHVCISVSKTCHESAHAVADFRASLKDVQQQSTDSTSGVTITHAGNAVKLQWHHHAYDIQRRHFEKAKRLYERHCVDDPRKIYFNTRIFSLCVRYHFYLNSRNQGACGAARPFEPVCYSSRQNVVTNARVDRCLPGGPFQMAAR